MSQITIKDLCHFILAHSFGSMSINQIHGDVRAHFTHSEIPNGRKTILSCLLQLIREKKVVIVLGNRYQSHVSSPLTKSDILKAYPNYRSSYEFYPRINTEAVVEKEIKKSITTIKRLHTLEITITVIIAILFVTAAMQWWR